MHANFTNQFSLFVFIREIRSERFVVVIGIPRSARDLRKTSMTQLPTYPITNSALLFHLHHFSALGFELGDDLLLVHSGHKVIV